MTLLLPLAFAACTSPSAPLPQPTPAPQPTTPDVIRTYAVTDDSLYAVVLKGNAADQKVMTLSYSSTITDAAQVGDVLYASTFSSLLRINLNTQAIAVVGNYGPTNINALAVDAAGQLYATGLSGRIYTVNTTTGAATEVLNMGMPSSGDLTFGPDGTLYATVKSSQFTKDALARINVGTKAVTVVGGTGYADVFGLDYLYGTLYGRTNSGELLTLNPSSGQGTLIRDTTLRFTSVK
ncbi:DUF4394 domain-containing protein [Deinococcus multiflagellatus]|uniref:DUF4394 domain-containing protein n=1 Tax=Deinococcus multiflagellatus TaxID=1656887 RepID=A0ABW1ZTG8_9DEIO|nr:DUF4394 domain-containing protein [Deinococcus multiflagellatus]MBZ9714517.1 DUF4394 domain-containing protein [Deinococcus multiflagellatus]